MNERKPPPPHLVRAARSRQKRGPSPADKWPSELPVSFRAAALARARSKPDLGPEVEVDVERVERGKLVAIKEARPLRVERGEVAMEEGEDPEQPATGDEPAGTVRRGRFQAAHLVLLARGVITGAQYRACERYLADWELASGARERSSVHVGKTPSWLVSGPQGAQLAALTDLRFARTVMGPAGALLVEELVVHSLSLAQIAARLGRPAGESAEKTERRAERNARVVQGQVVATLQRLVEAWEL